MDSGFSISVTGNPLKSRCEMLPRWGIRVIDLSCLVSSNMVNLQLADFGAKVIKIEDPNCDNPLQAWQTEGVNVQRKIYSRNTNGLALNLRAQRGRELLGELIASAQVRVENFQPGTLKAMGLAPDDLHRRNPLIMAMVPARGRDRSYRDVFRTKTESISAFQRRSWWRRSSSAAARKPGTPNAYSTPMSGPCRRMLVP